jgi:uncharacterized membrane protein
LKWNIDVLSVLLSGAGLAVSAGLNATLPLLILGLADRISGSITLNDPFDFLSSNAGVLLLLVLLPIELIADKIPRVDHLNDRLHSVVRPISGAICFMAIADQEEELNLWIAGILGLAITGVVHGWKMRIRPRITAATRGMGNSYASLIEDFIAIIVSLIAVTMPWGVPIAVAIGLAGLTRAYRRLVAGESSVIRAITPRG